MPYSDNSGLPESVRNHLPGHAQTIWRKAFNSALETYGGDESKAAAVAWSAVKRQFRKVGDRWVGRTEARAMWETELREAQMTAEDMNDLPDSAFAYIEPGGKKDASGRTTPRSLRHFPVHDAAHARNALARASQSPFGKKAMAKIMAACRKFGIKVSESESRLLAEQSETPIFSSPERIDRDARMIYGVSLWGNKSAHGYGFAHEALSGIAPSCDKGSIFINHPEAAYSDDPRARRKPSDVRDLAGEAMNPRYDEARGRIVGDIHAFKGPNGDLMMDLAESAPGHVGISALHDSILDVRTSTVRKVERLHRLDFVAGPATTHGMFEAKTQEDSEMDISKLTLEELREGRPDLVEALSAEAEGAVKTAAKVAELEKTLTEKEAELLGLKQRIAKDEHEKTVDRLLAEATFVDDKIKAEARKLLDRCDGEEAMRETLESIKSFAEAKPVAKSQEKATGEADVDEIKRAFNATA